VRLSRSARNDAGDLADALGATPALQWDDLYLTPHNADVTFAVDASGQDGCGGFSLDTGEVFHAAWPKGWRQHDLHMSTALQEMVAITFLAQTVPEGTRLCVWTDSSACKDSFGKARSSTPIVNQLLRALLAACLRRRVHLVVAWHFRDTSISAIAADHCSHGAFQDAAALVPGLSTASVLPASSVITRICTETLSAMLSEG
jgi:hypothetical protein